MKKCYTYEVNDEKYISFANDKFLAAMAIADITGYPVLEVENVLLTSRVKGEKVMQSFRTGYCMLSNYKKT